MRHQPRPSEAQDHETRTTLDRLGFTRKSFTTMGFAAFWVLLVIGSFVLDDSLSPRFFDLPIGAFLAGQGALMGLVIVGIRVARADLEDLRR